MSYNLLFQPVIISGCNTFHTSKNFVINSISVGQQLYLVFSSATSTGSFGTLETSGQINASGRIFENGTSVIDHATAMAIVFGG